MLEHNGKLYARVSDVLRGQADFSYIKKAVLEKKQSIGTLVHAAIDDYTRGEPPVLTLECEPYFESFVRWEKAVKPKIIQAEKRYFNDEYMITGQVDRIVALENHDLPILVDWKTSASESPSWVLQGHLYRFLAMADGINLSERMLFIQLKKDGTLPKVFTYAYNMYVLGRGQSLAREFWETFRKDKKELAEKEALWA